MSEDPDTLKSLHRALINLNKRAERSSNEILVSNFVDSEPLFDLLATHNNQVIYGRRGTGKTHALKYLAEHVSKQGDRAVYIDLRSVGSNNSIYSDTNRPLADRALTLIVDVLQALYNELLTLAVSIIDQAPDPAQITLRIDDLASAISAVQISGSIEEEREGKVAASREAKLTGEITAKPQGLIPLSQGRPHIAAVLFLKPEFRRRSGLCRNRLGAFHPLFFCDVVHA